MDFFKLETISKLLGSWALLFIIMFVSTGLLILPNEWIIEPLVLKARTQHLGIIGLIAISSWLFIIAKTFISIYQKIPGLIRKRKMKKESKKTAKIHRSHTLKRLKRLDPSAKRFLLDKKENDVKKFERDSSNKNMIQTLYDALIIEIVDHYDDIWEFEIHDWIWELLDQNLLFQPNNTEENQST